MTLSRLSKTKRATFIVTGKEKASIVSQVINCTEGIEKFPAAGINPIGRRVELFLDKEAASEL